MASHRRARLGSSTRQGAGIVAAALACLLLAPVLSLAAPATHPVASTVAADVASNGAAPGR
jgi:hypothetical protein